MCLCWKENPLTRPTFADITKRFPYYLQTYKVHFLFFFFIVVNFILNVRFNKSLVFHAQTVAVLPWTKALTPGLGRQNAVICMKLSTQVSTSVLSRGPSIKERGKFYCLLPYYFLKGSDRQRREELPLTLNVHWKHKETPTTDTKIWRYIIILKFHFNLSTKRF